MSLAGCFGYQTPGKDWTYTCSNPGPEIDSPQHVYGTCERSPTPRLTKGDILGKWGSPDSNYTANGSEHWLYTRQTEWSGSVIYFFVPIPLPVPKLEYATDLTFVGDDLTFIQYRIGTSRLRVCGFLPMGDYFMFFPSCRFNAVGDQPSEPFVSQERSDRRVLPPGSRD